MEFFDSLIRALFSLTQKLPFKSFPFRTNKAWTDIGYNQVILQRDTAFELGGTGFNLVSSLEIEDKIILAGNDLAEIKSNSKFARVSIVQIEKPEDEQKLYNLIRKIEYVKYHWFPEGYMIRTSSRSHKETVRVSKSAVKNKISFETVGNLLINKYKEIPGVKSATVIFITAPNADFDALEEMSKKSSRITETLNHIMNSVHFDCDSCNLKPVCDEVEGMKELHFKNSGGMK